MFRRKPATITSSALKDIQRAHDRLDKASERWVEQSQRLDQAFHRINAIEAKASEEHVRVVALEDATHEHPTEGDEGLAEHLGSLDQQVRGLALRIDEAGNRAPVPRDYLNDDWPRLRPYQEDTHGAVPPVYPCPRNDEHDAHPWSMPIPGGDTLRYCPGYPDEDDPPTIYDADDEFPLPDPVTLAAGDENKTEPVDEDEPRPTLQQRYWLEELLRFHDAGRGGQVTGFHGPIRAGKTWLMRQLNERGYPDEGGAWREWAERWAAPVPQPGLVMHVANPQPDPWVRRWFERTSEPTRAQRTFLHPRWTPSHGNESKGPVPVEPQESAEHVALDIARNELKHARRANGHPAQCLCAECDAYWMGSLVPFSEPLPYPLADYQAKSRWDG